MSGPVEVTVTVPGRLVDQYRKKWPHTLAHHEDILTAGTYDEETWAYHAVAAAVKRAPLPIEVGDMVRRVGWLTEKWHVEGVRGGWAWVFAEESESGELAALNTLTRVDPVSTEEPTDG